MIRDGAISDFTDICAFDPFAGDRRRDIEEGRVIVFEIHGDVCGFLSLSREGLLGRPYVQYLAVSQNHRRTGIAISLLEHIEFQHKGQRLFISTECTNEAMENLLVKLNYRTAGKISSANLDEADEIYYCKDINA